MKRKLWVLLSAALVAAFLAGGYAVPRIWSADNAKPFDRIPSADLPAVQSLKTLSQGFEAVSQAVIPSVVTITSEKLVKPTNGPAQFFGQDPFFQHFFNLPQHPQSFKERAMGSGVIVNPDGYILTNNHVVQGADELTVILSDGNKLKGKVVGTDPRTDLAVVKVDKKGLPAMPFADSDKAKVGEWVLAVGSPFSENLQHTVTSGIISATGRRGMNLNDYEDFIQTDAAINPGNSGGALVDLNGELIGINTAIASRTGGSNGIGFAIPSNLAMDVMNDLITKGKVTRGWLGVSIQNVTQDLADAMGLPNTNGVLVNSVLDNGPAKDSGLKQGDVIVAFDGKKVKNSSELRFAVAGANPGSEATLKVLRDGKEKAITLKLGEYPENPEAIAQNQGSSKENQLGITVAPITPDMVQKYNLDSDTQGLVVTDVTSGSPADDAGIQPGDVVVKVNREKVSTLKDFQDALSSAEKGSPDLLLLNRGGNTFFVALRPGS
jgi:serine protease Do